MDADSGPFGCIFSSEKVAKFGQNIQLKGSLNRFMNAYDKDKRSKKLLITRGDLISLAGKVAVELEFPCIRINWRGGRKPCSDNVAKKIKESGPPGFPLTLYRLLGQKV